MQTIDYEHLNDSPLAVTMRYFAGVMQGEVPTDVTDALETATLLSNLAHYRANMSGLARAEGGDVTRVTCVDAQSKVSIGGYLLNASATDANGAPAPIAAGYTTLLASVEKTAGNQDFYSRLASAMSRNLGWASMVGMRVLVLDPPYLGESSGLPRKVLRNMVETGDFAPAGAIMARALDSAKLGAPITRVFGNGTAARMGIALAAGLPQGSLERLDVCSPTYTGLWRQLKGYTAVEGRHRAASRETTTDIWSKIPEDAQKIVDHGAGGLKDALGLRGLLHKIQEIRACGHPQGSGALIRDMLAVAGRHPKGLMTVITPAKSETDPSPDYTSRVLSDIGAAGLRQLIIPDASLSFDDPHPSVLISAYNHPWPTQR